MDGRKSPKMPSRNKALKPSQARRPAPTPGAGIQNTVLDKNGTNGQGNTGDASGVASNNAPDLGANRCEEGATAACATATASATAPPSTANGEVRGGTDSSTPAASSSSGNRSPLDTLVAKIQKDAQMAKEQAAQHVQESKNKFTELEDRLGKMDAAMHALSEQGAANTQSLNTINTNMDSLRSSLVAMESMMRNFQQSGMHIHQQQQQQLQQQQLAAAEQQRQAEAAAAAELQRQQQAAAAAAAATEAAAIAQQQAAAAAEAARAQQQAAVEAALVAETAHAAAAQRAERHGVSGDASARDRSRDRQSRDAPKDGTATAATGNGTAATEEGKVPPPGENVAVPADDSE